LRASLVVAPSPPPGPAPPSGCSLPLRFIFERSALTVGVAPGTPSIRC